MKHPYNQYPATVTRVIDHDTFVANLDMGMNIWRHDVHIQVNDTRTAPAIGEDLVGKRVALSIHSTDGFGRLVSDVTRIEED